MHWQLFLPNVSQRDDTFQTACRHRGLDDLFDQPNAQDVMPIVHGPHDSDGLLVAWLKPGDRHEYAPQKQTWLPSHLKGDDGQSLYWCGIWNDSPPTQSEMRRVFTREGQLVQLGGAKWLLSTPDTIDSRAVYNDDGTMRWEPIRQFSWMCDEAKILKDEYLQEFGLREMVFSVEPSAQIGWLLKLLRVNYRITPEVAAHLDLWLGRQHLMDLFLQTLGLVRKGPQSNG